MKRLVAIAALLTLWFPAATRAQWRDHQQAGYPPYGFRVFTDWQPANLYLDISPNDANVFVDAHYVGPVADFNSSLRRLALPGGPHLVKIRKPGFRPLVIELAVFPGQNVTVSRRMQPSADADDPEADVVTRSFEDGASVPAAGGPSGNLRLDAQPREAEVFADGFYVGTADDFNGSQHMRLTQGQHHLVLKHDGYETLDLNLSIDAERPAIYRVVMKRLPKR